MVDPIKKLIVVQCDPHTAFSVFAERTTDWWPLDKHSLTAGRTGNPAKSVTMEPGVGGRIIETTPEGEELHWGSIKVYEPGKVLCFSWHVSEPVERATEVEIRFEEVSPQQTQVTLEHRNWHVLGEGGEESRGHYNNGWVHVFEDCFGGACQAQRARA
ncbi:hypothetical protein [Nitratireductor sp. XY-223]|uniref:hypothetical protein n=1 Tax=Nitratireductor sp. XY-223 TaxID=2561926 RepID=UPI0010A99F74|nr:hypothetical protein [Nitratireductor sp. XY-223]